MKKIIISLLALTSSLIAFEHKGIDWKEHNPYWKTQDGIIIGENPDKKNSVLWTQANYKDFELVVKFKTESNDYDSGVFLRGSSHQVQIGISRSLKKDLTGCIYCPVDGKGKYPEAYDKVPELHKLGKWNEFKIVVKGKKIQVWLNGTQTMNYDALKIPAEGSIGLQLHAGVHQKMEFEIVSLKEFE